MPIIVPYIIWAFIHAACERYGVDETLFIAIGLKEKGKYEWTDAVLGDLDLGLSISPMQLNMDGAGGRHTDFPGTRQDWANHLTKPEVWTDIAADYIARNSKQFPGDLDSVISAYNQGAEGVRDRGPDYNRAYVEAVLANMAQVRTQGITVVGSGDHDRQTFIPSTGKWEGYATQHAPRTGTISEAYDNVLGVADAHAAFLAYLEGEIKAHPR